MLLKQFQNVRIIVDVALERSELTSRWLYIEFRTVAFVPSDRTRSGSPRNTFTESSLENK